MSWCKIQDSLDADIYQFVGDVLSCIPRNSDYSQIDPSILQCSKVCNVLDNQVVTSSSHLPFVYVKCSGYFEPHS